MDEIIRIAVCDDNGNTARIVKDVVAGIFQENKKECQIEIFKDGDILKRCFAEKPYNLIFLDISMPGQDGIQLGEELREKNSDVEFIFVSSHEERVFETFKVSPVGFVRKNNFVADITNVVENYLKSCQYESGKFICLKTKDGTVRLVVSNIMYIEGARDSQIVHMADGENIVVISLMYALEQNLKEYGFIRVHKGYLVNYRYIRKFSKMDIILTNGESVLASRRKMSEIKQEYIRIIKDLGTIIM